MDENKTKVLPTSSTAKPKCACVMCSGNQFNPVLINSTADQLTVRFAIGHRVGKEHYLDVLDGLPARFFSRPPVSNPCLSYLEFKFHYAEGHLYFELESFAYTKYHSYDATELTELCSTVNKALNKGRALSETEAQQRIRFESLSTKTISSSVMLFPLEQLRLFNLELAKHTGNRPKDGTWFTLEGLQQMSDAFLSFYSQCGVQSQLAVS